MEVVFATGVFCVYFFLLHLVADHFGRAFYPEYSKLKECKKTEYRSYLLSPVHSLVAVILSILGTYFVCDVGNIFTNSECLAVPRYIHIWALQHTCAWFIVDTFFMAAIVRGTSPFDLQMYAHHFLSVFTWYSTLFFMNFTVAGACAILFVEVSTIFVSFRWLLYTHKLQDTVLMPINTVLVFLSFLFGRTIYMWFLCSKYIWPLLIKEFGTVDLRWWQALLVVEQLLATTMSALLNTYWMWLIVKQVVRVIQRLLGTLLP